jgi:hypothetical protein
MKIVDKDFTEKDINNLEFSLGLHIGLLENLAKEKPERAAQIWGLIFAKAPDYLLNALVKMKDKPDA